MVELSRTVSLEIEVGLSSKGAGGGASALSVGVNVSEVGAAEASLAPNPNVALTGTSRTILVILPALWASGRRLFSLQFRFSLIQLLTGILFICFNVDFRLLWGEVSSEDIKDGIQFYTTFYNSPPAIKALLHGMMGVGMTGLVSKLHKWDESAMFFDGTSLGIYVFAMVVYITVIVPMLGTTVSPAEITTQPERVEALRVLSAANVIVVICLGAILTLQAGHAYVTRTMLQQQKVSADKKRQ
ncbi:Protein csh3 [Marasmius crinis-equi]|uniref:Protein csh3 n=1 Tax=Marasmius crinis-equi TaxID=585013 RepID=A0ABR3FEW8_9AGAR